MGTSEGDLRTAAKKALAGLESGLVFVGWYCGDCGSISGNGYCQKCKHWVGLNKDGVPVW